MLSVVQGLRGKPGPLVRWVSKAQRDRLVRWVSKAQRDRLALQDQPGLPEPLALQRLWDQYRHWRQRLPRWNSDWNSS